MRRAAATTTPTARRASAGVVLLVLGTLLGGLLVSGSAGATTPTAARRGPAPDFRVASFNLLGYGHTVAGGDRRGFADGRTRTNHALRFLNLWRISVVGFQEFQPEQRERFMELTGDRWSHYPGDTLSRIDMHNSIAWRTRKWELIDAYTIKIPYFFDWQVNMPYVLLKHVATGRLVWFANFHNPANTHGNAQARRDEALRREVNLANQLNATGIPVIFTGDMNESVDYFCGMTTGAAMKAAAGGSYGTKTCRQLPPRPMGIDWIFGSNNLTFSHYHRREGKLVEKTTDHPVVYADVTLPPA